MAFEHLKIIRARVGLPVFIGGGSPSQTTVDLKSRKAEHSTYLKGKLADIKTHFEAVLADNTQSAAADIVSGVPLLLKVDPKIDIEYLRTSFDFEIISEQEDGYVIVASEDLDFESMQEKIEGFSGGLGRCGTVAQVHEILFEPTQQDRLKRVLSENLFKQWSELTDDQPYIVDIGVSCSGKIAIPKYPEKKEGETPTAFSKRVAKWEEKHRETYIEWDLLKIQREEMLESFVTTYQGKILEIVDGDQEKFYLPDSINVRVEISGRGLKDIVLNFPYLIDAHEPEEISNPLSIPANQGLQFQNLRLQPPHNTAPRVCVIDSGIQEEHILLANAIDGNGSKSYIPGQLTANRADEVRGGGHGTRVAGAVLFPNGVPTDGNHQLKCWIQNARVLNAENKLPENLMPAVYLERIVKDLTQGEVKTRIYNHSIGSSAPCRLSHISLWAAAIDYLSHEHDVLFVQPTGNILDSGPPNNPGIKDLIRAGFQYPEFLTQPAARLCNPAQSLLALTVGSISHTELDDGMRKSFAKRFLPSAFSRSGLGIWNTVKPDVVEFGGDLAIDTEEDPNISVHRDLCDEHVRSTLYPPSPAADRDKVGTSFVAPKVSSLAADLATTFPEESALFYKTMIVHAARWPDVGRLDPNDDLHLQKMFRLYGYGLVDRDRTLGNNPHRVTLYTAGARAISAREAHLFKVPVPESMRAPGRDSKILIEVTLGYTAQPKRTRKNARRYFSTWVDWQSNWTNENLTAFSARVLKNQTGSKVTRSSAIPWFIGPRTNDGEVSNIRRGSGPVQKDWAYMQSYDLPREFLISIAGHEGWNKDPEDQAKYCLTVSFEAIDRDMEIYNDVKVEVDRLTVNRAEV